MPNLGIVIENTNKPIPKHIFIAIYYNFSRKTTKLLKEQTESQNSQTLCLDSNQKDMDVITGLHLYDKRLINQIRINRLKLPLEISLNRKTKAHCYK